MPRARQQKIDKSGTYFIIFIIIVGAVLVYYFSENQAVVNNNENKNEEVIQQTIINQNTNDSEPEITDEELVNNNANTNTAIGGDNLNELNQDLGINVFGYDKIERSDSGDIANLSLRDGNSISVLPSSYEAMIKNSYSITNEETIYVNDQAGVKYTGKSTKDGSEVSFVLVEINGQLYHFKGLDSFLNNLESFVKFE